MSSTARSVAKPSLVRKGDVWAKKVEFYLLWFEYLATSPSYELARRYREGTLTADERAALPEDFDTVLAVFDDLGDVQRQDFQTWWLDRGIDHFGYHGKKPSVRSVAILRRTKKSTQEALSNTENYIRGGWREQGRQTTLIMAIPVGLTKAQIARQISAQLNKFPVAKRQLKHQAANYKLAGKKLDRGSLFRYLEVVWFRARFPKLALWRIGAMANVSSTYSMRLDPQAKIERNSKTEDRLALKILTSRALSRGRLIAENAARGVFPSYKPCPNAVDPNTVGLGQLISSRRKWKRELKNVQPTDGFDDHA